jgi:hypothetical protein
MTGIPPSAYPGNYGRRSPARNSHTPEAIMRHTRGLRSYIENSRIAGGEL